MTAHLDLSCTVGRSDHVVSHKVSFGGQWISSVGYSVAVPLSGACHTVSIDLEQLFKCCAADVALESSFSVQTLAAHTCQIGAQAKCHKLAESTYRVWKNEASAMVSCYRSEAQPSSGNTVSCTRAWDCRHTTLHRSCSIDTCSRYFCEPIHTQPSEVPQSWDAKRQLPIRCYIGRPSRVCLTMASNYP